MKKKKQTQLKPGDHVIGNSKYVDAVGVAHEGILLRSQPWREGLWLATMHHPVLGTRPHLIHESVLEKFEEEHVGKPTKEVVKLSGFTWVKTDRNQWVADKTPPGEIGQLRIKMLDERTYPVYRNGVYLGSEHTMEEAAARAKANERRPQAKPSTPVHADVVAARAKDKVRAEVAAKKKIEPRSVKSGERNTAILAMLSRGCTREEVLRVTGWKAVSMQQMAAGLGVGLRVDKDSKPFKYYTMEVK